MTNETDLRECCAQIELVERLINQPETFDIRKVLVELETKKELLMKYKPRDYQTILKDLHPGVIELAEREKELEAKKAAEIKSLKAKLKEAQESQIKEIKEEVKAEIPGE